MNKITIFRSMLLSLMTTGVMMTGFSFASQSAREMIAVCHYSDEGDWPSTIRVPMSEISEHLNHGDYMGFCEVVPFDEEFGTDPASPAVKQLHEAHTSRK